MSEKIAMELERATVHLARKRSAEILDNTKRLTTKAGGGGDDTALKLPRSMKRNVFPQVGGKFCSPAAQDEAPKRQGSAIKMDEQSRAQNQEMELSDIRDTMKTAYEQCVGHTAEKVFKPKQIVLVDEIKFYATKVIGHLPRKWKKEQLQRVVKDIVNEVKAEADNEWNPLKKCNNNEKNDGDISTEVEQLTSCLNEMKRQKQILMENAKTLENASNNILNAPNKRKYEKKDDTEIKEEEKGEERKLFQQLQDIIQQLHTKAKMRVNANKEIEDEVSLIKTRITKMWKSITNESMTGYDSKQQSNFEPVEMLDNIEASFFILKQQNNRYEKERGCMSNELKGLTEDIEDLTKKRHVESDEAIDDGIQKEIRKIRLKLYRQKRDFSERQIKQQDEHKWLMDLWNVVSEEGVTKKCETGAAAGSDSDITGLRNIIIQNMKRWKTDRIRVISVTGPVLQEILRLMTNAPFNFSVPKHFDSNKIVKGISPVLHPIVTDISLINQCLKENCKRYEEEQACISNELKELTKEIEDITKTRHVKLDEAIDDGIQKQIRQIRSKLDRQKHDFSERRMKQQDEHKWLTDLWNVVSEEGVTKNCETGAAAGSDSDITRLRNIIIQNMKRWKTDRILVISVTGPVLQEILRLMTNAPFNFSVSKHFDSNKIVKGISPVLHPVVTDISWINQCLKENCKSFQQKFVRTEAYNELKENEKTLLYEIKDLKKEKDVLLNRLSKVAGANLTDNNPNIADLSDPNRATKLAEQFSELYDNPWTDAFEVLETPDERRRIDFLLDIIVESYNVCRTISQNQQEVLMRVMHSPSESMTQEKDSKKPKKAKTIRLSKLQSKTLAELRKQCADISVADVKSFISTEHKAWVKRKELEKYTMMCIELCWLMHLQSPPVYMDVHVEDGTTFNTNKHKQYTKTGTKLDFLVWPALMLNEGGPILCKGVAQGK